MQHPAAVRAALVEVDRARLLEHVDDDVGVAAHAQPAAGLAERLQRTDAVAEVTLGRRAGAHVDLVRPEQRDVVGVDVDGVHRGQIGTEDALAVEELGRRAALHRLALLELGGLLGEVHVQRRVAFAGVRGDYAHRLGVDRADAVDGGRDAHPGAIGQVVDASRPGVGVTVAEGDLLQLEGPAVHAAAQVAGVDQRDPDPLLGGGVDQGLPQLVAMAVEVVELADGGDAGLEHLAEDKAAVLEVVGRVPLGVAVHALPPLPEVAAARLDLAPEQALERVAVDVGEARDRPALEGHRVRWSESVLHHRRDATALDLDEHVLGAAAEPGLLGVPFARADQVVVGAIGMRTPRSRATSTARS